MGKLIATGRRRARPEGGRGAAARPAGGDLKPDLIHRDPALERDNAALREMKRLERRRRAAETLRLDRSTTVRATGRYLDLFRESLGGDKPQAPNNKR